MEEFIHSLPKAELHVHLEGSVELSTLREIQPDLDEEAARRAYGFEDFSSFLKGFAWVASQLRRPEDYGLAARRLLESLERQNVRYVEVTLSAGVVLWRGQDLVAVHEALREATRDSSVECWWIWDAVRQWDFSLAERVVCLAAERAGDGVIAFGLGGDEERGSALRFEPLFSYARRHGLRCVCHAGELTGPRSIWEALEVGAERIGHGLACVEDEGLLRYLAASQTPLEICISSNYRTGAILRYGHHPLRRILDAGVCVTLNTDDPALFQCTLESEYRAALDLGVSRQQLEMLAANAFRHAFRTRASGFEVCGS
ncbi:MAG: adenosine deaminase [Bryobacteraceae bacterium]|nr:adenosine deaminase [Bryobacteraceae bacterium]MDW8378325.1 adenosine deaminase [Bryobacterales bacterium]